MKQDNSPLEIPLAPQPFDWEPLAPSAVCPQEVTEASVEARWAMCTGYEVLKNELFRYCCGSIRGQSFLIAGHRGAGKTLLTHLAIQIVRWRIEGRFASQGSEKGRFGVPASPQAIPMLVSIHGPDLLLATTEYRKIGEDALGTHALEQILYALQKTFKEELLHSLKRYPFDKTQAVNFVELMREIHGASVASSLMRHWKRLGLIQGGVLAASLGMNSTVGQIRRGSQAHEEVLLLESLNHCADNLHSGTGQAFELQAGSVGRLPLDVRTLRGYWRIAVPIMSLAAAVFFVSKIPTSGNPFFAWILPIAAFFLTLALTRKVLLRDDHGYPDASILEKRSLMDLGRAVPVLVSRLCSAGYAPVFVVDELDKVPQMKERLRAFMRQLKYFATDESFFCFLADRSYFEGFEAALDRWDYPEEQTYFGHRVLVSFSPAEIDVYLARLLGESGGGTTADEAKVRLNRVLVREFAGFDSRCHPAEVNRFLREGMVPGRTDCLKIDEGGLWIAPGYRFSVYCGLVLKHLYYSSEVTQRLRQSPAFSAWILDALYYVPHRWRHGKDLSLASAPLAAYLNAHVGTVKESASDDSRPRFTSARVRDRETQNSEMSRFLSTSDFDFLKQLSRRFAKYLAQPWSFVLDSAGDRTPTEATAIVVLLLLLQRPLLRATADEDEYVWEYDVSGRPLGGTPSNVRWRYFQAIRESDLEDTSMQCYVHADLLLRNLASWGLEESWIHEQVLPWWPVEYNSLKSLLEVHKPALEALMALGDDFPTKLLVKAALTWAIQHHRLALFASILSGSQFLPNEPSKRIFEATRDQIEERWRPKDSETADELHRTIDAVLSTGSLENCLQALAKLASVGTCVSA